MVRASAKNYKFTGVVVDPESYDAVLDELGEDDSLLSLETRESLAVSAFNYTAQYEAAPKFDLISMRTNRVQDRLLVVKFFLSPPAPEHY